MADNLVRLSPLALSAMESQGLDSRPRCMLFSAQNQRRHRGPSLRHEMRQGRVLIGHVNVRSLHVDVATDSRHGLRIATWLQVRGCPNRTCHQLRPAQYISELLPDYKRRPTNVPRRNVHLEL